MLYNYIMNPVKMKNIIKKVRARNGTDIFWTNSEWNTKEIDGVTFIPVSKQHPLASNVSYKDIHWMKKDNMEYVK